MPSTETQTLLDDAARKLLAWQLAAGEPGRGDLVPALNAAVRAYAGALVGAGMNFVKADAQAKRAVNRRAWELWRAENGSPKEITIRIVRSPLTGGVPPRPLGWLYECTGPDRRPFDNRSIVDLRDVLRRSYPGVAVRLVELWKSPAIPENESETR